MEDKEILSLFGTRNERAIEEIRRKFGAYLRTIARSITGNDADAEEIENDTYLKAWNAIPPAAPDPLKPYLGAICRRTALDYWDKRHAECRTGNETALALEELSELLSDPESDADFADRLALHTSLDRFLQGLPPRARIIFLRRYWYLSPISDIARDLHLSENHVAVLLHRTRVKLKQFLKKEGIDV